MASNSVCYVFFVLISKLTKIDRIETLVSNHREMAYRQSQARKRLIPDADAEAT